MSPVLGASNPILDSYEDIPYEGGAHIATHPSILAATGVMLGLRPQDPHRARVLEIGCAMGGNLLPLAAQLPDSQFVGLDLSPSQIATGQALADAVGLDNVQLIAADVTDPGVELGGFDYVICHGVFSWVPEPVRRSILEMCRDHLNPSGIAYISYNSYPGAQARHLASGIARFGAAEVLADRRSVPQVRALWRDLAGALPDGEHNTVARQLRQALDETKDAAEYYVAHEYLEDVNQPIWFYEFVAQCQAADLQYLGEVNRHKDLDDLPEDSAGRLTAMSPSLIAREQLLDLATNCPFRRSLVCRADLEVTRQPVPEDLPGLHAAAQSAPVGEEEGGVVVFRSRAGREFRTNAPLLAAALRELYEAWPNTMTLEALFEVARTAAGEPAYTDPGPFLRAVTQLWLKGGIVLLAAPLHLARQLPPRPCVHPLARYQAEHGMPVTSQLHQTVDLPDPVRALLPLLDGSRDRQALEVAWRQVRPQEQTDLGEALDQACAMGLILPEAQGDIRQG